MSPSLVPIARNAKKAGANTSAPGGPVRRPAERAAARRPILAPSAFGWHFRRYPESARRFPAAGSGTGKGLPECRRENRACSRRSEEHTSELQSQSNLVCRLLLEKKNRQTSHPAADRRTETQQR